MPKQVGVFAGKRVVRVRGLGHRGILGATPVERSRNSKALEHLNTHGHRVAATEA
jgi:hypothetical protein